MMEKLTVDAEGKIIIPPEVIQKRGLTPTMNSHSLNLLKAYSFMRAASTKERWRGGSDSTTRSASLRKMTLTPARRPNRPASKFER